MARRRSNNRTRSSNRSSQASRRSNSSSSSIPTDFLGIPPSRSASTVTTDASQSSTSSSEPQPQKRVRKQGRPKRFTPAIREIIALQSTTNLLIPRLPFQRVIREILQEFGVGFRVQGQAIEALRESSELYLVQMFSDALLCMIHAKRATLLNRDIQLLKVLALPNDIP